MINEVKLKGGGGWEKYYGNVLEIKISKDKKEIKVICVDKDIFIPMCNVLYYIVNKNK